MGGGGGGVSQDYLTVVNIFNLSVRVVFEKEAASHSGSKTLCDRLTWCDSAMYLHLHNRSQLITSLASVLFFRVHHVQTQSMYFCFHVWGDIFACIHGFFFFQCSRTPTNRVVSTLNTTCEPTDLPVSMEVKDFKSSGLPGLYIDDSMGARGAQLLSQFITYLSAWPQYPWGFHCRK